MRVSTLIAMGCLFAIGCVVGLIAGRARRSRRETRIRLFNKPKKTSLAVLVPPGPAPRLIPGDSPNATRARLAHAPVRRQTPAGATRAGMIDYIAAFADTGERPEATRVDYLLVPDESAEAPCDACDPCDTCDDTASSSDVALQTRRLPPLR